jgi:hypothetical protein
MPMMLKRRSSLALGGEADDAYTLAISCELGNLPVLCIWIFDYKALWCFFEFVPSS